MREAALRVRTRYGTTVVDVHLPTSRLARDGDKSSRDIICSAVRKKLQEETGVPIPHLYWGRPIQDNGVEIEERGSVVHHFNPVEARAEFVERRRRYLGTLHPGLYKV